MATEKVVNQIVEALSRFASQISNIKQDWWIIGGAALALRGVDIGNTGDIDILTNREGAAAFMATLDDIRERSPKTKEDNLFRSSFSRYKCGKLEIEVMGDLELNKNGQWILIEVADYDIVEIGGLDIKLPTLRELKRILRLFGREKDLRRIESIDRQFVSVY